METQTTKRKVRKPTTLIPTRPDSEMQPGGGTDAETTESPTMNRNESISSLVPLKSQRGGGVDESRNKQKARQLNPSISVKALHDKNRAILPSIESAKHSQDEDPVREQVQVRRNHNIKSIDSMER